MKFTGSMVALVTPFKAGKVDEMALAKLVEWQIQSGTQVLVPCGTTGESATLTHEEHERVIRIVLETARGRVRVLAGAGSNSTAEALKLHRFCLDAGVDGALHITPYYNKPTQEGLYQHYKALSESCSLPIVLYNVPSRTGVHMQPQTVIKLSEFKNIVGIKESSGQIQVACEIMAHTPADFTLISGEDALNYPLYVLGAQGAISVTCNILPEMCAQLYRAVQNSDFENAKKIHYDLLEINQALFWETNPIPVKAALSMMGRIDEEYRLPLLMMSAEARTKMKDILKKLKQIF